MTWIRVMQSTDGQNWKVVYAGPLTASTEQYLQLLKPPPYTVIDRWTDEGYGWMRAPRERNYLPRYA